MNINDNIEKYFTKIFVNYFNEIQITDELINNYKWDNISQIFDSLYGNLLELSNQSDFIKNYYLIMLLYVNYTNFLKFINHPDSESTDIFDYLNKIKNNTKIIKFIYDNITYKNFDNIFNTFNPFIKNKFQNTHNILDNQLNSFILNIQQLEKIYLDNSSSQKKILNTMLYRYILSSNISENNFHNFFIKNIIDNDISYNINFKVFMEMLPNYKNIVNLTVTQEIKNNLGINLSHLINFLIKDYKNLNLNTVINSDKTKHFELINTKIGGKIIIKKSTRKINELNIYQQNINLIGFNIKELKNYSFVKKTNNLIVIEYSSSIINNLSNLLHLTHLLTCGIKLLETYPSSIYECLYPIDYNKYYYSTFVNLLTFIKSNINKDMSYNRFLIDLIKYYYIYSYYDYYFYYNTNLVKTIIERVKHKNNIFNEFCESLKIIFKLPSEMSNYPPFFNISDDIDNLIYYGFEIPNYFKFMDLINAIITVFDIEIKNPNKFDLIKIILTINCELINCNNTQNITLDDKNDKNDKTNIQQQNISDKQVSPHKQCSSDKHSDDNVSKNINNAYIELNADNSDNYALNTDFNF
jgi:hypothetical protein